MKIRGYANRHRNGTTCKLLLLLATLQLPAGQVFATECVVLLHGLMRTDKSMQKLQRRLQDSDYIVANISYPSRKKPVEELSVLAVEAGLKACAGEKASPINFVTHSLGGILLRHYYSTHNPASVARVVMLGPPNHGSEVVDELKNIPGFEMLNGPAGKQLGTDKDSIPARLGPANFELGVIAGTRSVNPVLSSYLPNPDDGKVSLESARLEGMCAFLALPVTHPFMMKNDTVIEEVRHFLSTGKFSHAGAQSFECGKEG